MIVTLILLVVFILSSVAVIPRFLHMLQLSSYQSPGYGKWIKDNAFDIYKPMLPVVIVAVLGVWNGPVVHGVSSVLFALTAVIWPRKKAKKPMVYTSRVIRILTVLVLLLLVIACAAWFIRDYGRYMLLLLSVGFLSLPYLVMLSNWITMPLQKLVNNFYIDDAKKRLREQPGLTVIGITGSYGKTSAKYFLSQLLSVSYNVLMTPESYNTPMGVVRTIRERLDATHQVFVCEMGARHVGDIKEICDIVSPKHGILTSIGPQHLETFKSIENVISTKFELINALPSDGFAVLADDNEFIRSHPLYRQAVRYGLRKDGNLDFRASDIRAGKNGTTFTVTAKDDESQVFVTPLIGRHQVENITAAIAMARSLGIPLVKLTAAVRNLRPVPHRLQLIPGDKLNIIDDAYNSNPAGAKAALDTLALFDGVKILVTPGMVELGEKQDELNAAFGREAAAICDYIALVGVKQTAPIAEALSQAGFPKKQMKAVETLAQAMEWVKSVGQDGREKFVLLENDLPDNY